MPVKVNPGPNENQLKCLLKKGVKSALKHLKKPVEFRLRSPIIRVSLVSVFRVLFLVKYWKQKTWSFTLEFKRFFHTPVENVVEN